MTQLEGEGKEVGLWRYNDLDSNPGSAICWKDVFKLMNLSLSFLMCKLERINYALESC